VIETQSHQKTTKGACPFAKYLIKATINQKKLLISCFDLEMSSSSLSRHDILSATLDIYDALFELDDDDIKKTGTPDLAMLPGLFDFFPKQRKMSTATIFLCCSFLWRQHWSVLTYGRHSKCLLKL
jgi:hypothetical protein